MQGAQFTLCIQVFKQTRSLSIMGLSQVLHLHEEHVAVY